MAKIRVNAQTQENAYAAIADQIASIDFLNGNAKADLSMVVYQGKDINSEESAKIVYDAMNNISTAVQMLWQTESAIDSQSQQAINKFIGEISPVMVKSYGNTEYYYQDGATKIYQAVYALRDAIPA